MSDTLDQLYRMKRGARNSLEKMIDDGDAKAATFAGVLPKLEEEIERARDRAGLAEDACLEVAFVNP